MKKIIQFGFLCGFLVCCKKNKPAPVEEVLPNTGYYGLFTVRKYTGPFILENDQIFSATVHLHATPQTDSSLVAQGKNLGAVKANGITLQYFTGLRMYLDTSYQKSFSQQVNFQHSSETLGSIDFTNTDPFPVYPAALVMTLEDTLDKTKNYHVPLGNFESFDKAQCTLIPVSKTVATGVSEIVFTPADLASLTSGTLLNLKITLSKFNDQTINNKRFRFENGTYFDTSVFVK